MCLNGDEEGKRDEKSSATICGIHGSALDHIGDNVFLWCGGFMDHGGPLSTPTMIRSIQPKDGGDPLGSPLRYTYARRD